MYDDEHPHLPESDLGGDASRPRRRIPVWMWLILGLVSIALVAAAVAATVAVMLDRDEGRVGSEAILTTPVIVLQPTGERDARLLEEPESPKQESEAPLPTITVAGPEGQALMDETAPGAGLSTPEPIVEPTLEPTSEPTPVPTATELAAAEPAPEPIAGRIAFVDQQSRLWTAASDGRDRRLLTGPGRSYQFPSWSPAGNDVAVIGNDREGGGVYVVADEEDSQIRQLYSDGLYQPIYLYWSPQGENVSFIASHPDGLALHMAPGDGAGEAQLVATSPSTFFWDWMPDGSQVLIHTGFTALSADETRLAFVPLTEEREAEEIQQHGYFQAPAVAADGRYFSYSDQDPSGNRWLSVHDLDENRQVELVFHQGVVAMGFSPTRPQLAFTSPSRPARSFYGALRLADLESGQIRMLVSDAVLAFFWSPDGRSIAYLTLSNIADPFEFEDAPVAGWIEPALTATGKDGSLSKTQSPQDEENHIGLGLSVVDVDTGETRLLTVFEPSAVFLNQFLPFFDQYALSHRLWSPDSRALVMPITSERGRDFIVVVPVDGGEPRPVARGVAAFWSQQ